MKVMLVNCVYNEESTGKIIYDIRNELRKIGHKTIVCYGRGKDTNDNDVFRFTNDICAKSSKLITKITGLMYGACWFSTKKLINKIILEKPDIVNLHCINGNIVNIYEIVGWLKRNNICTVLTLHAEFMYTANCGYSLNCDKWRYGCGNCPRLKKETGSFFFDNTHQSWLLMKDAFSNFKNLHITSVSPWLKDRAKQSEILGCYDHRVILNGVDTDNIFHFTDSFIRKEIDTQKRKIILHVTASFSRPIKGGKYVIELAERIKDVLFVIVGNDDHSIMFPPNVIDVGYVNEQNTLAQYYSMADLFLITSEKETFGMTVAESLCCGTPVVGFKAGAPEQIALSEYSEFVDFGNVDLLEQSIYKMLNNKYDKKIIEAQAIKKYSKQVMTAKYLDLYNEILKENGCI